ncbi:MAG: peptidase T, partial [Aeromonas sp.]
MDTLLERFLRYVTFHTRSDETNPACPSSEGQRVFARALHAEMVALGMTQVTLDNNGYLTACLPGNQPDAPA